MVIVFHLVKQSTKPMHFLLALLYCVSRDYSTGLSASSVIRVAINSEPIRQISFKFHFSSCLPLAIRPDDLFIYLFIFFVFANMGPYWSKHYSSLKSLCLFFQTCPECSSQRYPQKYCLGFLNFDFFSRKFRIYHCTLRRNLKP